MVMSEWLVVARRLRGGLGEQSIDSWVSRASSNTHKANKRFPHNRVKVDEPKRIVVFRGSGNAHVTPHRAVARVSAPLDGGYLSGDHR
jgi:hypothetical protein